MPGLDVKKLQIIGPPPARLQILDNLSFELAQHSCLGVVGESGSGKSSLIGALLGLLPPGLECVQAEIYWAGRALPRHAAPEWRQLWGRKISASFQDPALHLNPVLRIGNQMAEVLRLRHATSELEPALLRWLTKFGFVEPERIQHAYAHQLSGGEKQRVMLAMAFAAEPELLLLDEPTQGLDLLQREVFAARLREFLAGGGTALLASHDLSVVEACCDQALVLYQGKILEAGSRAELLAEPCHPYTRALLNSAPARAQRGHPLATYGVESQSAGCCFKTSCAKAQALCGSAPPPLAEVQLQKQRRRVLCHIPEKGV